MSHVTVLGYKNTKKRKTEQKNHAKFSLFMSIY